MKITTDEVRHVAYLARLKVDEEELGKMTEQLNNILSYMDKLNELDTSGLEPMAHALPLNNAFREDTAESLFESDETMANAPQRDKAFFLVPRVI